MNEIIILQVILVSIFLYIFLKSINDYKYLFSPVAIVSYSIVNTFVKDYYEFPEYVKDFFLDEYYYKLTVIYAIICIISMEYFFSKSVSKYNKILKNRSSNLITIDADQTIPRHVLTTYVTLLAVIGLGAQYLVALYSGGLISFYSSAHGSAGQWDKISAYLYSLPNFLWPALLISYVTLKKGRGGRFLMFLSILIASFLAVHTFLFGNRNGVIKFVLLFVSAYAFLERPNIKKVIPILVFAALGVALVEILPQIRQHLHLGSDMTFWEAVQEYLTKGRTELRVYRNQHIGHELFVTVAIVQSSIITGVHDYGMKYIFPLINFVPRALWPDKPTVIDFGVDIWNLIYEGTGWYPSLGAAYGAVGHSFLAFSWFGVIAWMMIGHQAGKLFAKAAQNPNIFNLGYFFAILVACVYWSVQAFMAFFFQWLFMALPIWALKILARYFIRNKRRCQNAFR